MNFCYLIDTIKFFVSPVADRWISKKHGYIEGPELRPDIGGEELFLKVSNLVKRKWDIPLLRHDVLQLHKAGQFRVIILFSDLKVGSAFSKLLNPNKRDYLPG